MTSSSTIDKLQQEDNNDPCVQMTDVTIETNIDPHDETTTTTTTVHLPFQIAKQCPPPKVISWMKSRKPASIHPKTSAQQSARPHPHHHNSSRHNRTVGKVQQLLPFLNNKRRSGTEKIKKGDQAITVFSIQVNILGKVLVPPTPQSQSTTPTASSTSPQKADSSSSNGSSSSISELSEDSAPASAADLAPVKTLPAQLHRSATTSYVIHRTFEDFQRLSEMVLNLQAALMTAPGPIPEGPELKTLAVRHPHPGLYQALLKQVSHVKANQRAFDASSTTHGFDEEGAFERVLELNQYLEDVWYWLLPENTPESLNLSLERHDIMQWLKPSSSSSHADGRQMRERSDQPSTPTATARASPIASPITVPTDVVESDLDTMTLSTTGLSDPPMHDLSVRREEQLEEEEDKEDPDQLDQQTAKRAPERMSSVSSLPSLSSSTTSAFSSTTSSSTMSEVADSNELIERQQQDKLHQPTIDGKSDGYHLEVAMQGSPHTLSTMASSTLVESSDVLDPLDHHHHPQHSGDNTPSSATANATINNTSPHSAVTVETLSDLAELPSFSRRGTLLRRHHRDSHLGSEDVKLKRRMSFSQVFKSLAMPISNNNHHHRHSQYDASTPGSVFDEEIYIWNTVTTKNLPRSTVVV
ncbi:hypothetical protein EC957_011866 [Mortierella hygrophila]|uniref:PX domain-containing protein n=1 Tax=Mortierella hygrophila TaxID=979708 RepID=A0A9P6F8T1_9FUNG|nr:hypothetical protein EC957_011866 [Mortierella hygrophila]